REVLTGRDGGDGDGDRTFRGPHAERARVEEGDGPQVRRLELVDLHDLEARGGNRAPRIRNDEVVQLGRLVEALEVRVQPENRRAVVGRVRFHPLEDAGAVLQSVREHVHFRVAPGYEFAVEPDCFSWCKTHDALQDLNIYRD